MKQRILTLLLLCLPALGWAAQERLSVNKFGGLNSDDDPVALQEDESPDAQNVITDSFVGLGPREGYVSFSTITATDFWVLPHSNGTRYLIAKSSNVLKADIGAKTFPIYISTVPLTGRTAGTVLGDRFFFANATDGLKYADFSGVTANVAVASATLKVTQLATHKGRVWGAGLAGSERTIFGAEYLIGTNFTLSTAPTSNTPTQITVGGSLDEPLTALYSSHRDQLIWMKAHSFGSIYGNTRVDFGQRVFSDKIGTAYSDSIQDCDGDLRWLGPQRKIYEFTGSEFYPISENENTHIRTLMGTVLQGDANSRTYNLTSQSDFGTGTFGLDLSSTSSAGDVQFSTTGISIDNFADGDYTASPAWTTFGAVGGGAASIASNALQFTVPTAADAIGAYTSSVLSTAAWSFVTFASGTAEFRFKLCAGAPTSAGQEGGCYTVHFKDAGGFDEVFSYAGTTLLDSQNVAANLSGSTTTISIDRNSSGSFVVTINDVVESTFTDTSITSITYISVHETNGTGFKGRKFDDFAYHLYSSTYTTPPVSIGTAITAWGAVTVAGSDGGGTHSYAIYGCSSVSCSSTTYASSQTITSGAIPSFSTYPYVALSDRFTRTSSTMTPTVSAVTFEWNEGSTLRVASAYSDQRYVLGVAISSTTNNRWLVYDHNENWQKWTLAADAMVVYNSNLLFGNASGTFQHGSAFTDNGTAITAYWTTKTRALAGLDTRSKLDLLYMTTQNSDSTLSTSFYLDGYSTENTLASYAMNAVSGTQHFRLPFSFSGPQQGRSIGLKWSVTGSDDWRILNGTLYHRPDPVPSE